MLGNKLRLYIYCPSLSGRGGVETVLKTVSRSLRTLGHECVFLFTTPSTVDTEWESDLGTVLYTSRAAHGLTPRFPGEDTVFVSSVLDLQSCLARLPRPDVVLALNPGTTAAARMGVGVYGRDRPPVVSWMHASIHAFREKSLLHYADAHLAISTGIRDQLTSLGIHQPITTVFNPVDIDGVKTLPRPKEPKFAYVGRLDNRQKRIDVLLKALAQTTQHQWTLELVGDVGVADTDGVAQLQRMADELGLSERIHWAGWQRDPWRYLEEVTALILPSDWEGFGMVLVEALARGVPVIASNCFTGPSDIVTHGRNGWLFSPGDVDALRNILTLILSGDIKLPTPAVCVESAQRFAAPTVVENFASALRHYAVHL